MEINKYEEILGVVTTADVTEGKFGVLTSHSFSNDFGSMTDLPGWKVPATAEEATRATNLISFPVDNRPYPQLLPIPSYAWSLRQGFGNANNVPFTATMYITNPANQENVTIPSGTAALAFQGGVFTIPSGQYVYSASLQTPGALVQVCNTAEDTTDAGKLKYLATKSYRAVGIVRHFDATTARLTVEIEE